MVPFKSLAVQWLLFIAMGLGRHVAAEPASSFLVGPEPRPLVFETVSGGSPRADDGSKTGVGDSASQKPRSSAPIQDFSNHGDRNLHEGHSRSSHDFGSVSQSEGYHGRFLQAETCNITKTILGFNYTDNIAENGAALVPGHPMGAVGVSRLVAVGNAMLEVRQKDGTPVFLDGFKSFFSAFPEASDPGTDFFLPRIVYDEHAGRFVIAVMQRGFSPQVSRIWLAVSKDENPDVSTGWHKSYINSTIFLGFDDCYALLTGLEVDEEVVYFTASMFRFASGFNVDSFFWVVRKGLDGGFYDGGVLSSYRARFEQEEPTRTPLVPTQVHGSSGVEGSVGTYFIALPTPTTALLELLVFTLFDPQSANPTFNAQKVNLGAIFQGTSRGLPDAPQLGTAELIGTSSAAVKDAVWRNGKLWVVFNNIPTSGVNVNQTSVHWVRFGTAGSALTLEAQGDIGGEDIAAGTYTYYPSVAVNSRGVVAYGYGASSPTTYAGAYVSVGTSENAITVQSGLAPYRRIRDGINRWGDYSGIAVDPTDDSFWVFNQYAETTGSADSNGDGRWGTAWGRLACANTPVPAPVSTPVAPAPVLFLFPVPTVPSPVPPFEFKCGLFGLSLFCPFTLCGFFGRLLGLCVFDL